MVAQICCRVEKATLWWEVKLIGFSYYCPLQLQCRFNGHRQEISEPHIWLDKTPGWHIWWTIVGLLSPPQCNCASPECLPGWADHHNSVQASTCGTGLIDKTRRYFFVIGWEVGLLNWISGVLPKKNPRCICTSSECWPKCADYQNLVHALTCSKGTCHLRFSGIRPLRGFPPPS